MELKAIIKCFKLPSKIGNILISSNSSSISHLDEGADSITHPQRSISEPKSIEGGSVSQSGSISYSVLELSLKDGLSNSTLLDLGKLILESLSCFVWVFESLFIYLFFSSQDVLYSWWVSTKNMYLLKILDVMLCLALFLLLNISISTASVSPEFTFYWHQLPLLSIWTSTKCLCGKKNCMQSSNSCSLAWIEE